MTTSKNKNGIASKANVSRRDERLENETIHGLTRGQAIDIAGILVADMKKYFDGGKMELRVLAEFEDILGTYEGW